MSCKSDVRKAIIKQITDKFVYGRNTYFLESDDTVSIVSKADNSISRAKSAAQALAIANNLADRISEYTNGHVRGWVNRYSEYDPYTVTLRVSNAYVDEVYNRMPSSQQTEKMVSEGPQIGPDDLPPINPQC